MKLSRTFRVSSRWLVRAADESVIPVSEVFLKDLFNSAGLGLLQLLHHPNIPSQLQTKYLQEKRKKRWVRKSFPKEQKLAPSTHKHRKTCRQTFPPPLLRREEPGTRGGKAGMRLCSSCPKRRHEGLSAWVTPDTGGKVGQMRRWQQRSIASQAGPRQTPYRRRLAGCRRLRLEYPRLRRRLWKGKG